MDNSDSCGR